ncbi:hypothetical protein Acy02nite_17690 [Actinoplanes cyaneus]|uniref:Uncharacterized protein n=1 Tax=Actinoplanes cyaneus TaxID=52696 RepID=A0A919IE40_9ACTN|nr:hypothetical protein Acy02nite_17690 [Actinoplanes cyaneus]
MSASFGSVVPLREDEILAATGGAKLTREHIEAIDGLAEERWIGRCAVLHDTAGNPSEIYFWGFSGD